MKARLFHTGGVRLVLGSGAGRKSPAPSPKTSPFLPVQKIHAFMGMLLILVCISPFAKAAEISIPRAADQHKAALIRAARFEFGLNAPVALLAAQVHTESRWNPNAVSPVGAAGLAQFMPSTAAWLPTVAPYTGEPLPFNPGWSLRALCAYDSWLYKRVRAASPYDAWAFTLSAYNGGLGWVQRDQTLAARKGLDPKKYWGSVETVNAGRSAAAIRENRSYPRRIFEAQTVYKAAGWGRGVYAEP